MAGFRRRLDGDSRSRKETNADATLLVNVHEEGLTLVLIYRPPDSILVESSKTTLGIPVREA